MEFLLGVTALVALVCLLWLVVVAFKTHILWGLACLFLPFATAIYGILNWDRAAKPFLAHLASTILLSGLAWYYVASAVGQMLPVAMQLQSGPVQSAQQEIIRRVQSGQMTEDEGNEQMGLVLQGAMTGNPYLPPFMSGSTAGADLKVVRDASADPDPASVTAKIDEAIVQEDTQRAEQVKATRKPVMVRTYVAKDPHGAGADVGKTVRLKTTNGLTRSGGLVDVNGKGELVVEQRLHGGQAVYTIGPAIVAEYKVLEWVER